MKSRKAEAFIDTDTDINIDNIKFKKKQSIYKTLETWHKHFNYFNIKNILQLAVDPASGITIKDFKMMDFCETCALVDFK